MRIEPPGAKTTVYWPGGVVKRNDPGACPECGSATGTVWDTVEEHNLSREVIGEHAAERLDQGMYSRSRGGER